MEIIEKYALELLNEKTVNIIKIESIIINNEEKQIGRSSISFGNSIKGRQKVSELLPEKYAQAVFDVWGEEPILPDP